MAEQIEIFRGPTTLLYGSGAVGGVVNTVTRRLPEIAPESGFEGAFELRGDSVAADRTAAFRLDGGADRFAWHVDALTRDTDDYEIPGYVETAPHADEAKPGVLANSDLQTRAGAVGGSWLGDSATLGVSVSRFETLYGIPGHHHEEDEPAPDDADENVRIDLSQTRYDFKGNWLGVGDALRAINLRIGVNDYRHVELEGSDIGTVFSNDAYEGRLEFLHSPVGHWDGAFGLQFGHRKFSAVGPEAFVPGVDTTSHGLFVIEQRDFERWNLALGSRVERLEHAPVTADPHIDDTASSVSAAAIRRLDDEYSVAFNLQRAERSPVAEELYAEGPHLASSSFELGNADLGKETSRHLDVGLRKSEGAITWAVTFFYTQFDDFIFLRDTALLDSDSELPIFAFDQQDADIAGMEAEIFAPLAAFGMGELDLRLYADYVEGELDSGEYLPRLPPLRFGARLQFHTARLLAGIEATRYDRQIKTAPFETATDGYTMVNADLRWLLPDTRRFEFSLFLKASNLLDEDARRHTSMVKAIAPLPGRNYSVAFRAGF